MARQRFPYSEFQNQVLYTIGRLESGDRPQEAINRLVNRFGLSPEEAAAVHAAAVGATGAAVGASIMGPDATLEEVTGRQGREGEVIAEATVTINRPGAEPEYRTIRADQFDTSNTVGDLERYIESVVADWRAKYDREGITFAWTIRYIM